MTVADLGQRMSSAEFAEWMAYERLEPFGSPRDDYRAGAVASIIANVNRDPKRRAEPFGPGDFFAEIAPPPVRRSKLQRVFGEFRKKASDG